MRTQRGGWDARWSWGTVSLREPQKGDIKDSTVEDAIQDFALLAYDRDEAFAAWDTEARRILALFPDKIQERILERFWWENPRISLGMRAKFVLDQDAESIEQYIGGVLVRSLTGNVSIEALVPGASLSADLVAEAFNNGLETVMRHLALRYHEAPVPNTEYWILL